MMDAKKAIRIISLLDLDPDLNRDLGNFIEQQEKRIIEQLLRTDHNWLRDSYNKTRMALRAKYPHKLESHLDALACIALADYLASMWIWGVVEQVAGVESITMTEKIIEDLITKADADESERTWA